MLYIFVIVDFVNPNRYLAHSMRFQLNCSLCQGYHSYLKVYTTCYCITVILRLSFLARIMNCPSLCCQCMSIAEICFGFVQLSQD